LIGEWNFFSVSLGIREKIILDSHWFMKDKEAIDWREGFQYFHWTRGTSSRRGQRGLPRRRSLCIFFWKKEEEIACERKELVFMCEKVMFMGKKIVCKQRAWKEVVCSK
jgi:hypothetical protein